MSDFNTPRDLPNAADAYDTWSPSWTFGDGNGGCGAMPLRNGTGLYAKKCLRGEDWAFLHTLTNRIRYLPSYALWTSYNPPVPAATSTPQKSQLQAMYNFLTATQSISCFGSGISLTPDSGTQVTASSYAELTSTIKAQLTGFMQIDSQPIPNVDTPLTQSRIETFFADTQDMRCTIANANYYFDGRDRTCYDYVDWFGQIELETTDISSVAVAEYYGCQNQMIRAIGQVLCGVECSHSYGGQDNTYYAVLALGQPFELRTSQQNPLTLAANVTITGQHVADVFHAVTGVDITPSTQGQNEGRCTIRIRNRFLAVWPKWLLNY